MYSKDIALARTNFAAVNNARFCASGMASSYLRSEEKPTASNCALGLALANGEQASTKKYRRAGQQQKSEDQRAMAG
jgi:hypothetical protein